HSANHLASSHRWGRVYGSEKKSFHPQLERPRMNPNSILDPVSQDGRRLGGSILSQVELAERPPGLATLNLATRLFSELHGSTQGLLCFFKLLASDRKPAFNVVQGRKPRAPTAHPHFRCPR